MLRTETQTEAFSLLKKKWNYAKRAQTAPRITIDFETRCVLDVREVGSFLYSRHPSCRILMMSYNLTGNPEDTKLWTIKDKRPPKELLRAIKKGAMLNAFNTYFEYCVWQHVATKQFNWPALEGGFERTLDVADKCKALAMPSNLEEAAKHSRIADLKDTEGKRLIKVFSTVQDKGKYKGDFVNIDDPDYFDDWLSFCDYCVTDTKAEVELDNVYPDLDPLEQLIAWMTQDINWRGLQVDLEACEAGDYLTQELKKKYNKELCKLSDNTIERGTQRQRVKKWLAEEGYPLENMQGPTVKQALREKLPRKVKRMLELYQITGSTSASKYATMIKYTDMETLRIHELINYHKARTGRYGGKGIQMQNLPRPRLPKKTDYKALIRLIKKRDLSLIEKYAEDVNKTIKNPEYHVNPMIVLSSAIRSVIIADAGKVYRSADYSAIECRKLMWLANQKDALESFKRKEDIYLRMAETIYNKPYEDMDKESRERPLSKEVVLGAGYQMWATNFREHIDKNAGIKISEKESERVIKLFRKKFNKVPKLWEKLDAAVVRCVKYRRAVHMERFKFYMVKFGKIPFLVIRLPSGHKLYYPEPEIELTYVHNREREQVSYMGTHPQTKQWVRLYLYGGKITENVTQASARDLMTLGMLLLHVYGYSLVMTVHDEVVSEDDEDFGSLEELQELLCTLPVWAKGMPVESEGWEGYQYRK